jgi:hypothetical protein
MATTEESRHELYTGLQEVIGTARATTLMEYLPPVGWADVATKRDLDALEERMNFRFEAVDHKFAKQIAVLQGEMLAGMANLQATLIRYYVGGLFMVLFGVMAIVLSAGLLSPPA